MKKQLAVLAFISTLGINAFAQKTTGTETKLAEFKLELRNNLGKTLNVQGSAADKIVEVETAFYTALSAAEAQKTIPAKQRELQIHEAHINRREKLMAIPLGGKALEDVIVLSEKVKRQLKL